MGPGTAVAQVDESSAEVVLPSAAYIGEATASTLTLPRWQVGAATTRTLWVYLAPPPAERSAFRAEIRQAVQAWNQVPGLPLTLRFTDHPEAAEVVVRWIRRFSANQAGTTDWQTNGDGWLASVAVTLAVEHANGTAMSDEFLLTVALHELGHVIGLPHSENPSDVMHPGNRNRRLSERDVQSAQRLYTREGTAPPENP